MSAESTLILVGLLVILVPFLGLPSIWYVYIFATLGVVVVGIGTLLRTRRLRSHRAAMTVAPVATAPEVPHTES